MTPAAAAPAAGCDRGEATGAAGRDPADPGWLVGGPPGRDGAAAAPPGAGLVGVVFDGAPLPDEPVEPGELDVPGDAGVVDEPGGEVVVLARDEPPEGVPLGFPPEGCAPEDGPPEDGPPEDGRDGVESVATDVAP